MGRWEPEARGRLQDAAFSLYGERGYAQTTVADIAAKAGLTERTFFRHFADKREVLFDGAHKLEEALVDTVSAAPASASPLEAVAAGLCAVAAFIGTDRERSRRRKAIFDATPELRERELVKLASLATALTAALRRRGVGDVAASVAGEAGIAVFRLAFDRWVGEAGPTDFSATIREMLDELKAVSAGGGSFTT